MFLVGITLGGQITHSPRLAHKWDELHGALRSCFGINALSPWDSKVGVGTNPAFKGFVILLPSLASVL